MHDPDEILGRMRADQDSDWPARLLSDLEKAPEVPEEEIVRHGHRAHDRSARLSGRELDVIRCVSHGMEAKEAAALLGIAYWTVVTHLTGARRKLRAKNTAHAACEAVRRGLIP